jgi:hypothetical protein
LPRSAADSSARRPISARVGAGGAGLGAGGGGYAAPGGNGGGDPRGAQGSGIFGAVGRARGRRAEGKISERVSLGEFAHFLRTVHFYFATADYENMLRMIGISLVFYK